MRAGHPKHVAERAEDDVGAPRDGMRPIDHFERRDADRASGTVHEFDFFRQKIVEPVLNNRVGLAAANLHERPGPCYSAPDFRDQLLSDSMVAVFVDVLHVLVPAGPISGSGVSISCNWSISARYL